MTRETLQLLRNVLAQQTLAVGQDGFLATATAAAAALAELDHELSAAGHTSADGPS